MNTYSKRNPVVSCKKKVVPISALAFFLCLLQTHAQLNISDSEIYNGDSDVAAIATNLLTTQSGTGNLDVLNPSTVSISITHDVTGTIHINNQFDDFRIENSEALTSEETPALLVEGGTNLFLSTGSYIGGTESVISNSWNGAIGGLISGTATTVVSGVTFSGGTLVIKDYTSGGTPPLPGQTNAATFQTSVAQGADGLYVENGHLLLMDNSTLTGGNGLEADSTRKDVYASGGNGLSLINSTAVITNGIFRGGNGGNAEVSASRSGYAQGGYGLYASNSTAVIHSGTFSGGLGGAVNGDIASGGSGLVAIDGSSITNIGGSFSGSGGTAAVQLYDSDFTSMGGLYTGGLISSTTGSKTNTLSLLGGTFDSISLVNNSSSGMQLITASNLIVSTEIYQSGGTVKIENVEDAGFENLVIDGGSMEFTEDLALTGSLALNSSDSKAIFQGLDIESNATVDLGIGQIDATGAFNLMNGATLNITILTNQSGSITAGSASFSINSSMLVDASLAGFSSGIATNTFLATSSGVSGFNTNDVLTEVKVSANTNVVGRTSFEGFLINANNLSVIFNTATLSNYWNATGDLAVLAEELEYLASAEMNAIINNMGPDASQTAIVETYFTTMNTFQVAKQGLDTAVGLSLSRGTEFRDQLNLPTGAKGPDSKLENDWRFWAKYYGNFYHRNQNGINAEYDATLHGGVIGMDKSFGSLLVGLSGGIGQNKIETVNDAEQNMDSYQVAIYSTLGKNHAYLDAGLAYGFNGVDSQTADPFILKSEFDTHLISAHLGGGYGFEFPDIGSIITPEAAIRYSTYQQEAYSETGITAAPRSFDEFDADSLLGVFGLNASMLNSTALKNFAYKLEGRAHWLREFNPEPGNLSYQLVGGANDYIIAYPHLDENTIRLGFGFTFFNTAKRSKKNILLRLDFDELFGEDFNSHNLSAKAIFAF